LLGSLGRDSFVPGKHEQEKVVLSRTAAALASTLLCLLMLSPPAHATFPGANGKIAFNSGGDIWTVNPDGSGRTNLTNTSGTEERGCLVWPGGAKIVFRSLDQPDWPHWTMNVDGSAKTNLNFFGSVAVSNCADDWTPDAREITVVYDDHDGAIYNVNADGSGYEFLTHGLCTTAQLPGYDPDWSPDGQNLAYVCRFDDPTNLYVWNRALNTDRAVVTNVEASDPDFSPDGTKIVYSGARIVNLDGTNDHLLYAGGGGPLWSPDGEKIAFRAGSGLGPIDLWTINPDGTGAINVSNISGVAFNEYFWSPDGEKLTFSSNATGNYDVYVVNRDGTGLTNITNTPGVDEHVFGWAGTQKGYARPKGATPLRLSLVPSYKQCTSPNNTHGAPLSNGSCAPPQLTSSQLTVGTPDSNGMRTTMDAYIQLTTIVDNPATPADEADIKITATANDVFNKDLSDDSGSLRAELPVRITDKNNSPAPGGTGAGTTVPFQFGFDVPCTATPADSTVGSDCTISTSADTLYPGAIVGGKRAIWQMGRGRIDDAGPDGNPDTTADNTVFLDQGVFVP
jgi:WD40 repeat protein